LPFSDRTAANRPTSVTVTSLNLTSLKQNGIDFDFSYRMPLSDVGIRSNGSLFFRALANYLLKADRQQSATLPVIHYAGYADNVDNYERWRGDASVGFKSGGFTATVSESFVSRSRISPIQVWLDDPRIPAAFYTDLNLQYEMPWSKQQFTGFLNVRNLFDKQSPVLPFLADNPGIALQTYRDKFDPTGIFFTAGVRVSF
jgi:iron complex outermembrane receptor protein